MQLTGLDPWTLFSFLGAAHALLVGAALLTMKDRIARSFGALLSALAVVLLVIPYSHLGPGPEPTVAGLIEDLATLWGAWLLLRFTLLATGRSAGATLAVLAVPPLVWVLNALLQAVTLGVEAVWRAPVEVLVGYQVAHTVLCAALLLRSTRTGENPRHQAVRWARRTVLLIALIHCSQFVRFFVDTGPLRNVVPATGALVVVATTFLAIRESGVFRFESETPLTEAAGPATAAPPSPTRYRHSTLSEERATLGLERLRAVLEDDQRFLEPDLSLETLARDLGIGRTHLSQLINQSFDAPLPEVLAAYRVREAERLLADERFDHLTVEAVGGRAGFQSKSTFYAAFKKMHGQTPAHFRRHRST